jgi:hypothetical protein
VILTMACLLVGEQLNWGAPALAGPDNLSIPTITFN